MADSEALDLVALICSRLCHDLAGSIGAVHNGVELLAEETDAAMREEAIGLIAQSASDAARRLAFFRLALGASGDTAGVMAMADLKRTAKDYFFGAKVRLDLPEEDADLPKALGKALLLGLALAAQALPRGGDLRLTPAGAAWRITGEGAMLRWPDAVAAALNGSEWPREPHAALARYAARLAASAGFKLSASPGNDKIALDFTP